MKELKSLRKPPPEDMVAFQSDEAYRPNGFPEKWFHFYSVSAAKVVEVLLEQMPHTPEGELLLRTIWKENGKKV